MSPGAWPISKIGDSTGLPLTTGPVIAGHLLQFDKAKAILLKGITAVTTVHRMEQGAFTARGRVQSIGEYRGTVQTVLTGAEIAFAGE